MKMNRHTVLIISSILLLASIFAFNWIIMALGFVQYFAVILYNMYKMFNNSSIGSKDIVEHMIKQSDKSWKEKKYFQWLVYNIAWPMTVVGMVMASVIICAMFYFGFAGL